LIFKNAIFGLLALLLIGTTQASDIFDEIINEAALLHGVPAAFVKSVIRAESGFDPNAESPVGAQGLMQLMPDTAAELGVTDSFDARQNIMGGALYLSQLLDRYNGDPVLALAAYNAGMGRVDQYGGVPPYEETINYITRISGYLSSYGGGSLNLSSLPTSFVTDPSTGGGVMAALESLPSLGDVIAAFELAVGISVGNIESGISLALGVIVLVWVSWHFIFTVGMVRAQALSLQSAFTYSIRALVLLTVFFYFISRGGL
jgi:hypothetical protein